MALVRVVGEGAITPACVRTGIGAKMSPLVAFRGMPKLAALYRIWVVGDMAMGANPSGEAGTTAPTENCFTGKVCAWASGTLSPGKNGLIIFVGERAGMDFTLKEDVTAGVTGDQGDPQASVEEAQGEAKGDF
mmetsp:Transcript_28557/g.77381  ORF Transcript_28557/g.77381 Transcript_28557/m.77381 type:complete len:133 (-) Transcript_28557:176-574(-)